MFNVEINTNTHILNIYIYMRNINIQTRGYFLIFI